MHDMAFLYCLLLNPAYEKYTSTLCNFTLYFS